MLWLEEPIEHHPDRDQHGDKQREEDPDRAGLDHPQHGQAGALNRRVLVDRLRWDHPQVVRRGVRGGVHEPQPQPLEELVAAHGRDAHEQEQPEQHAHRHLGQDA